MCKILTFTNASKLDIAKASESIGTLLLSIERDGFGYAVLGRNGVYGEKSTAPTTFKTRINRPNVVNLPTIVEPRHSMFGTPGAAIGPAMFHGRTSTNSKDLVNVHPMIRESWHLIHNGVVTDHGPAYPKLTSNDSEDVLHRLIQGISHVERDLSGYYAFTAIDPNGRLHVCRDSNAELYIAWVPKLESWVIGTTESLILKSLSALDLVCGPIDKIKSDVYFIFSRNEVIHCQSIKPRGYDREQSQFAELSLGRSLGRYNSDLSESRETSFTDDGDCLSDLMAELEDIDDSYRIEDGNGIAITASAFHKLDEVSRLECTIQREDGSFVETADYWLAVETETRTARKVSNE